MQLPGTTLAGHMVLSIVSHVLVAWSCQSGDGSALADDKVLTLIEKQGGGIPQSSRWLPATTYCPRVTVGVGSDIAACHQSLNHPFRARGIGLRIQWVLEVSDYWEPGLTRPVS